MPGRQQKLKAAQLRAAGMSVRQIALRLGVGKTTIHRWLEDPDAPDRRAHNGRTPRLPRLAPEELERVRARYIETNRTRVAGSARQAVLDAVRAGEIRADMSRWILERAALGMRLLPADQWRLISVAEPIVRGLRTPREAAFGYASADGALHCDGRRMYRAGEVWTIDDATINFPCWVELERPGDPCWERYGVLVGRFQFLLVADQRSYYIPAFSYVARPRQSYRAEDLLAVLDLAFRAHGLPSQIVLEHGISASERLDLAMARLGVRVRRPRTPPSKVAEGLFNRLWTVLSTQPGQLGRRAGDDERVAALYQRCRRGEADPRAHFLSIDQAVAALRAAIADRNRALVQSRQYGRWVPADWWQREAPSVLRPYPDSLRWLCYPVRKTVTVRGFMVRASVRLLDTHSTQFSWAAPELVDYHGAKVHLWFNPYDSAGRAAVTLAEDWRGRQAGEWICWADLANRTAHYTRARLGYTADPDRTLEIISRCRHSLRRRVEAIRGGAAVASVTEARDGAGRATRIERSSRPADPAGRDFAELRRRSRRASADARRRTDFDAADWIRRDPLWADLLDEADPAEIEEAEHESG